MRRREERQQVLLEAKRKNATHEGLGDGAAVAGPRDLGVLGDGAAVAGPRNFGVLGDGAAVAGPGDLGVGDHCW